MKYLFTAIFDDGSSIQQTPEDVSAVDKTRSAFYDVAQRLDEVVVFGLHSVETETTYVVDLVDGHFEINGVPFSAQPVDTPTMNEGGKFTLVYFRDHQHHLVTDASGSIKEELHAMQFRMGWKYDDPNGRSYTQTIVIV